MPIFFAIALPRKLRKRKFSVVWLQFDFILWLNILNTFCVIEWIGIFALSTVQPVTGDHFSNLFRFDLIKTLTQFYIVLKLDR